MDSHIATFSLMPDPSCVRGESKVKMYVNDVSLLCPLSKNSFRYNFSGVIHVGF